jgi:hypothetical protein
MFYYKNLFLIFLCLFVFSICYLKEKDTFNFFGFSKVYFTKYIFKIHFFNLLVNIAFILFNNLIYFWGKLISFYLY